MSTLNVRLSEEDDAKLSQILTVIRVDRSTLVRKLINDQWIALQMGKTFVERAGGHPTVLLDGPASLSSRDVRKATRAKAIEEKASKRNKPG